MFTNTKGEKIYYSNAFPTGAPFCVSMIGETADNPNFDALHKVTGNRDADKYTFEYVCDGIGYIETTEKIYTVKAGDTFILNKTTAHYYYSDKDYPLKKRFMVCNGPLVDQLMELYGVKSGTVIKTMNTNEDFRYLFDTAVRSPETLVETASCLVLKILHRIAAIQQKDKGTETPLHELIAKYIHENINYPLTPEDLCNCFEISLSTLFRVFDKHFHTTPKHYITSTKLEEAKNLLTSTTLSIGDISARLSYPYQNNFSAIFTRMVGCSPREYRKRNPFVVQKGYLSKQKKKQQEPESEK